MASHRPSSRTGIFLALLILAAGAVPVRAQYGLFFSGAGPINRSMAGVGMATAVDSIGALYWNPASLSGLERSELAFGTELIFSQTRLASTLPEGAIEGILPRNTLSGSDRSNNSVFPVPSVGLAYQTEDKIWTFGLGIFGVAGFGVNYPASTTNPILTPQAPNGFGLGSIFSQLQVLEIAPQVSCQLTDHFSVGLGPALDLALLQLDPAFFAPPDNASGNGFATYPAATHTQDKWGFGLEAGAYYTLDNGFRLGASLKSPRWFEKFHYSSADQLGNPRDVYFAVNLPLIASAGIAYSGIQRLLLGIDTHYLDYTNTDGFRASGFDATGAARGLGWRSIWAVAVGAQYQLLESVSLRLGYSWNQNPIDPNRTSFNVASPLLLQNTLSAGASYHVTENFSLSLAYLHFFQNSSTGAIISPMGILPGSSVTSVVSADSIVLGGTVRFGGPSKSARSQAVPSQGLVQSPVDSSN
ncbi:MAG TPA: outer membrane protein transport protein [Gemmataceae bacterium]|jgi:long-chain fatty acid transport protein